MKYMQAVLDRELDLVSEKELYYGFELSMLK